MLEMEMSMLLKSVVWTHAWLGVEAVFKLEPRPFHPTYFPMLVLLILSNTLNVYRLLDGGHVCTDMMENHSKIKYLHTALVWRSQSQTVLPSHSYSKSDHS